MTQNATNFINPITFETLTNHKCLVDTFDRNFNYNIEHVSLGNKADLVLVRRQVRILLRKWQMELQMICSVQRFLRAVVKNWWHRR